MTAPTRTGTHEPEIDLKLGFGDSVDLDVRYCDLVQAKDPAAVFDVRFRGYRAGTTQRVRFYCELDMIEGALIHEGVLRAGAIDRGARVDRGTTVPIPLTSFALTITKQRTGNGAWRYQVRSRQHNRDAEHFRQAVADAADQVMPALADRGIPVGSQDVLVVARELFRRRTGTP